jgi:hypothetical protein
MIYNCTGAKPKHRHPIISFALNRKFEAGEKYDLSDRDAYILTQEGFMPGCFSACQGTITPEVEEDILGMDLPISTNKMTAPKRKK